MENRANEPAFPLPYGGAQQIQQGYGYDFRWAGLTVREEFAKAFMASYIIGDSVPSSEIAAADAVRYADALINELERTRK